MTEILTTLATLSAVFICQGAACIAQQAAPLQTSSSGSTNMTAAAPDARLQQSLATFDDIWNTVVDRVWDDEFDLDAWEAARGRLRPQLKSATSIREVREILKQLIDSLEKSHYAIIPGEVYSDYDSEEVSGDGGDREAGIRVRVVEGSAVVTEVAQRADAYEQGLRPGWIIKTIRGSDTQSLIEGLTSSLGKHGGYRPETLASLMLESRLSSGSQETIDIECTDADGRPCQLTIKRHQPEGVRVQFGYLPALYVQSENREVQPGVGYVRFNAFFAPDQVMKSFEQAEAVATRGLVIDLRGNGGGLAGMTMGIANRLVADTEERAQLGIQTMKGGKIKYVLIPGATSYLRPVAVLVDECSISSAEILAAGLQALGRARVFGQRTAGAALPSMISKLPNGDYFQFAVADFVDVSGRRVEGVGVEPDEVTTLSRSDLIAGIDPALNAAVAWIEACDNPSSTNQESGAKFDE